MSLTMTSHILLYATLLNTIGSIGNAQLLDENFRYEFLLPDGVKVMVLASADDHTKYYYLPGTIQLSNTGGTPEISLLLYQQKGGIIAGGILHVLFKWGLSAEQQKKVQAQLNHHSNREATLAGAAEILPSGELQFIAKNLLAEILQRSKTASIKIATTSDAKTAASFNLSAQDATTVWDAVNNQKNTAIKFVCQYTYSTIKNRENIRIAEQHTAVMEGSFQSWAHALTKYKLIKFVSL
jgi:hypothetical protein